MKDFREEAEQHWKFIENLIKTIQNDNHLSDPKYMMILHFFYVESMVHGFKHGFTALPKRG